MLSVGINASPLAAPRTGVGRYIAGLLAEFEEQPDPGVRVRPLFAPGAAIRSPGGLAARAFATVRAAVKRLPAAYRVAVKIPLELLRGRPGLALAELRAAVSGTAAALLALPVRLRKIPPGADP